MGARSTLSLSPGHLLVVTHHSCRCVDETIMFNSFKHNECTDCTYMDWRFLPNPSDLTSEEVRVFKKYMSNMDQIYRNVIHDTSQTLGDRKEKLNQNFHEGVRFDMIDKMERISAEKESVEDLSTSGSDSFLSASFSCYPEPVTTGNSKGNVSPDIGTTAQKSSEKSIAPCNASITSHSSGSDLLESADTVPDRPVSEDWDRTIDHLSEDDNGHKNLKSPLTNVAQHIDWLSRTYSINNLISGRYNK
ncbi:unnamed protein product [Clavelina lepadiformis]|uniref:Uncharacterized protein n=1 Tax=Clavelina lepadiformis TaxID=159417 RepID=A0ABP0FYU1_CLALP